MDAIADPPITTTEDHRRLAEEYLDEAAALHEADGPTGDVRELADLGVEHAIRAVPPELVPIMLAEVEKTRVALWARMPAALADVAVTAKDDDPPPADRLIRVDEVIELTGLARTTIWRRERDGDFPARRRLGENSVAWSEREVLEWIAGRSKVEGRNRVTSGEATAAESRNAKDGTSGPAAVRQIGHPHPRDEADMLARIREAEDGEEPEGVAP